jgi:hypothetical protein
MQLQHRARQVDRVGQDGGQSFRDFLVRRKQNAKQRKSSQRDKPFIYSAKKIKIMTLKLIFVYDRLWLILKVPGIDLSLPLPGHIGINEVDKTLHSNWFCFDVAMNEIGRKVRKQSQDYQKQSK